MDGDGNLQPEPMQTMRQRRVACMHRLALQGLLILAFVAGGSSQISGWDDTFLQLLALPILAWSLLRFVDLPSSSLRNAAMVIAGCIALVPALQLLPIPEDIWLLPSARDQLAQDLAAMGVTPEVRWSLDPSSTERALLFLLPPLAVFTTTLTVGPDMHRQLLRTIMLLAMFSLLLAFLQLSVPPESLLNPFPQWAAQFNGVFANPNHQAISMVVAAIIALSGMFASIPHVNDGRLQAWTPWLLGFAVVFTLSALPLTGSRAAVLIAVFMVATVPLGLGVFGRQRLRHSWHARWGLAACVVLIALGVYGAIGWMQVDAVDELRAPIRDVAFSLGREHAPLGTGVGAFVAAFEQGGPDALLLSSYINHAHNEFLQWWMEAGWLGVLVGASALVCLVLASARALTRGAVNSPQAVVSILGLAALLVHSLVDYPLRTGSLAVVAGVLAGIVIARAAENAVNAPPPSAMGEARSEHHASPRDVLHPGI